MYIHMSNTLALKRDGRVLYLQNKMTGKRGQKQKCNFRRRNIFATVASEEIQVRRTSSNWIMPSKKPLMATDKLLRGDVVTHLKN
jgi:hypothetical protein